VQFRRRVALAVIGVVLAWALFQGFRPPSIEVELGTAHRGPLRVTIEQEGRTRVVDRYILTAPVTGYARRIELDVGNAVDRDATLVQLEPQRAEVLDVRRRAEAAARVSAAEATVRSAEQRVNAASSNAGMTQNELQRVRA